MSSFSTYVSCAGRGVTVSSRTRAVVEGVQRYFEPWWSAVLEERGADQCVCAEVDQDEALDAIGRVRDDPAATVVRYAGEGLVFVRRGGVVYAAQGGLAYRYSSGEGLRIVGMWQADVAGAAVRLAREVLRGRLLADGWLLLGASAVVGSDGQAVLVLGDKGAGKTTAAFLLARNPGWSLLADERVFVRPGDDGLVEVVPWPSTATVGFGLLEACGWSAPVRERLKDGGQQANDALPVSGSRSSYQAGRELKARLRPHQLRDRLGLPLTSYGVASHLLFPLIRPYAHAGRLNGTRRIAVEDVITTSRDDRYPDVFGLTTSADTPKRVVEALGGLPQDSVLLGHDADGNRAFLLDLVTRPSAPSR